MLPMPYTEAAFFRVELQLQFALVQNLAIEAAQGRDDQLAVGAGALPVDVEGVGHGRKRAPIPARRATSHWT